jgi:hypothetical protein
LFGYLLLGVGLLVAVIFVLRWYANADVKTLATVLKVCAVALIGVVIVVLAFSGQLGWALGAATFLLPWLIQGRRAATTARNYTRMASGPKAQTSHVETRYLRMHLDHETGRLDGDVLSGPFAGRSLADLSEADLIALFQEWRVGDPPSAQLLETYLDRAFADWRERADVKSEEAAGGEGMPSSPAMSKEEAYRVLGLEPGASEAEIKAAHHRLIAGLHPDRGGSSFLAAQVNRARDVLLGR